MARPSAAATRAPETVDIAIVTILPEEYEAVRKQLGKSRRDPGTEEQPNQYAWMLGEIAHAEGGHYRVVLAMAASPGNTSSSLATSKTIARWQPRYVLLVGIAGGMVRENLALGDVVISSIIRAYEYGKVHEGRFEPRPDFQYRVDGSLLRNALTLKARNWQKGLGRKPGRATAQSKLLSGPIASGDKVIDDVSSEFFAAVARSFPKLLAVEMEGAGAAAAIEEAQEEGRNVGFLMIRGISDMPPAGPGKPQAKQRASGTRGAGGTQVRDRWKKYAAEAAARFSVHLIANAWPVPPRAAEVSAVSGLAIFKPDPSPKRSRRDHSASRPIQHAGEPISDPTVILDSTPIPTSLELWLACAEPTFSSERLAQLLGDTYGARTSPPHHRGSKILIPLQIPSQMLQQLTSDAENGTLDALVIKAGAKFVQEILKGSQCLFSRLPSITFGPPPQFVDVAPEDLKNLLPQVDVVLLTTTDVERDALYEVMKPFPGYAGLVEGALHRNTYRLGQFGRYIAAHVESTMGSQARHGSTLTVHDAIAELSPKAVVIIGIAFGVNPVKQRLGDVIIAETVIPYELQRVDKRVTYRGQPLPCGSVLSERFRTRRTGWRFERGEDSVKVFQGPLLSGEKLSDNLTFRNSLVEAFPTAQGGEMEGAGAYAATERTNVEVILVKAICDWGDGSKTDKAQPFAVKAAVSLAQYVLSKRDVLQPLGARDRGLPGEVTSPKSSSLPLPPSIAVPDRSQRSANPKRTPFHLILAESGLREVDSTIALVGCVLMQRPEEVARALKQRREDLIHDAFLAVEEKNRLQRQGFLFSTDSAAVRNQMLAFLTVANFDVFAFYTKKTQLLGKEDALREALLTKALQSRLSSKNWPVAAVYGNSPQLHSIMKTVREELVASCRSNVSNPTVQPARALDPCLAIAEYSCALIRTRLEQILGRSSTPAARDPDFERIRNKVRWVVNISTGEDYHRNQPIP